MALSSESALPTLLGRLRAGDPDAARELVEANEAMRAPDLRSARPGPGEPRSADTIPWKLTVLLDEQSIDWQRGDRTTVETYLAREEALQGNPEVVLNLVYHEVLLRRRHAGEDPLVDEYVARFPHLADALSVQFALEQALPYLSTEPSAPHHEPPPSIQIAGYHLEEVLGRGGMGIVYRARHLALNRIVALKMVLDGAHAGPRHSSRFQMEAELIARLQHSNIVQIHEIGEHDGRPFLALEYVGGGTLDRVLAGKPQPAERAARLVETLARAVEHAHERGVVHRDLKPANVLLTATGEPKITDFGLAKLLAGDSTKTETGALVGTPSYMAPEQVEGIAGVIGPTTDVYALGAILYEALTGRPPFHAESPMATMLQVKACDVVPPCRLRSNLPRNLETICLKSLEKDPRRRYSTAGALADDLHRYLIGQPILARPIPAWERLWLWTRRQKSLAAGIVVALLAILALMAGGTYHSIQLGRLNMRLKSSNLALVAARAGAEENARDALATISQMLVRVADERLKGIPEAEPVRRDLLNDALKRLEPLQRRNPTNPEIRHEMARAHLGVGAIHVALGEFSRAIAQGQGALVILEPLVNEQPGDRRFAMSFAEAQLSLANLLAPADGKKHFLRAVEILEPLAETEPSARWKLASSYYAIAFAKEGFGLATGESYCARAISLLESLARDDPSTYNHDLARAVYNLALRDASQGKPDAAERGYRRCLQIWGESSSGAWSDSDQEGIAACQEALGSMLQARGQATAKSEAESLLRRAVDTRCKLARRHPRLLVHRQGHASSWSNLGSFYWRDRRYQEAESPYAEAVRLSQENVRDFPEERGQKIFLAHNYQNLADCWSKLKRMREARDAFEKALRVIDPLVVDSPAELKALECVGVVCLNYGNLLRSVSGPAASLPVDERCVRAFEVAHRLASDHGEMRRLLKGARGNLRATYEQLKHYDDALFQIEATLPLCDAKERAGQQLLRALILVRAGRHEAAVKEARSLEREPGLDAETLYNLACVYSLAVAGARSDSRLDSAGKTDLARSYAAEAIRLIARSHRDGRFPSKELLDLLGKDTDLEPIRGTPEFKNLLEQIAR